jgi:hypothetical protein
VELFKSFSHPNRRRAFGAAQLLAAALHGPIGPRVADRESWGDEFAVTLQQLDNLLDTMVVTAPVLVKIGESVHWHAFYGPDFTREPARRIIGRLGRDLETRTIRALMDGWGSNTWPLEASTGRPQHEAECEALCLSLVSRYSAAAALSQFLNECLDDIARATGSANYGAAQLFIGRLFSNNLDLARHVVHSHLAGQKTQLSTHAGRALGVLLAGAREETASLVERMLEDGDAHLPVIAEGYMFAQNLAPYAAIDIEALARVFASRDDAVLWYTPNIGREVARSDKPLAVTLLTSVKVDLALRAAPDFFACLVHDETIPFALVGDEQLRHLIEGLRPAEKLDDYWLIEFLKKAMMRAPGLLLDLAKARIDDAIADDDWGKRALGDMLRDSDSLGLLTLPDGPALLRDLLDWALGRIGENAFLHHFAALVRSLCGPYDAAFMTLMDEWLADGTVAHFEVASAILREADQRFVYDYERFISRALRAAKSLGRDAHRDLSSVILASALNGMRSGTPGQPFESDLRLKAMTEERLARLTKSDPAYRLYSGLRDHAARGIEWQAAIGRRMDEEDAEA